MIFNEIECHVNTFLGLVEGMHPLHLLPVSAPARKFNLFGGCFTLFTWSHFCAFLCRFNSIYCVVMHRTMPIELCITYPEM